MIEVGDTLVDNDPRMNNRKLYVRKVENGYAYAATVVMGTKLTRVRLDRIHEDDKNRLGNPRRTGYTKLPSEKV